MINTSNKDDFGWGNKIPTTGPSNLTNGPISDHSDRVNLSDIVQLSYIVWVYKFAYIT